MARYTLVYGLRLVPEGALVSADEVTLKLKSGESAGVTLHTIDGTIPQLKGTPEEYKAALGSAPVQMLTHQPGDKQSF